MGGPITRILATSKTITNATDPQTYYVKSDGRRRLNVYFRGVAAADTHTVHVNVKPVIPELDGVTAMTAWPDFSDLDANGTVDSTVPAVVPDQGVASVACTDAGVTGMVIVTDMATAGTYKVVLTAEDAVVVTYHLVSELI